MNSLIHTKLPISHPGEVFRSRFLERYDISVQVAADKLRMKRSTLSRFLNGNMSMSKSLAMKLEIATGVSARYWLSRQTDHDIQQAERLRTDKVDAEPLL